MKYFLISKIYSYSNLMSNFIAKIFFAEFLSNFKVSEFEHELELGDLGVGEYLAQREKDKEWCAREMGMIEI